jgi:hypothetical protein
MSENEYLKTMRSELEQVGWIYTYSDAAKKIPPVLSRHRLDNKHAWIERPIYADDQTSTVGAFSGEEESAEMDRQPSIVDVLIDVQKLMLDMGRTIRALDEDCEHSEYWNQDGEYIADDRYRALEALIRGERIKKGGDQ